MEQEVEALAGGELPGVVLALDALSTSERADAVLASPEVGDAVVPHEGGRALNGPRTHGADGDDPVLEDQLAAPVRLDQQAVRAEVLQDAAEDLVPVAAADVHRNPGGDSMAEEGLPP